MKKWIAKHLIDRAIDENRNAPAWIQQLLTTDKTLREYDQAQRALVGRLKSDGPGWIVSSDNAPTTIANAAPAAVGRWNSVPTLALMATAACVLIGALMWFNREPTETEPIAMVKPFEVEDIRDAVDRATRVGKTLSTGLEEYAAIVPMRTPAEIGQLTKGYVEEAGSLFGRGLAMLDPGSR